MSQYENALNDFSKVIELDPYYAEAYFERGRLYYLLDSLQEALNDLNTAISLNYEDYLVFLYRGFIYTEFDDLDHAIENYSKVLEFEPNFPLALYYRGQALAHRSLLTKDKNDSENALHDFNLFIVINEKTKLYPDYSSSAYYYRDQLLKNS